MRYIIFLLVLAMCLPAYAAEDTLYDDFRKYDSVKVYIGEVIDSTGEPIDLKQFRAALKQALLDRKSIKFKIVDKKKEADLIIDAEITRYDYRETDPIDMIMGSAGVVLDLAKEDNYVATDVYFTVKDAGSGKVRWSKKVTSTITKKKIPVKEAPGMAFERASKRFTGKAFGKSKKR